MRHGEVRLVKIDDPNMPADFLTKWLPKVDFHRAKEYVTNSKVAVPRTSDKLRKVETAKLTALLDECIELIKKHNIRTLARFDTADRLTTYAPKADFDRAKEIIDKSEAAGATPG